MSELSKPYLQKRLQLFKSLYTFLEVYNVEAFVPFDGRARLFC